MKEASGLLFDSGFIQRPIVSEHSVVIVMWNRVLSKNRTLQTIIKNEKSAAVSRSASFVWSLGAQTQAAALW
jgi:hypothetical protein